MKEFKTLSEAIISLNASDNRGIYFINQAEENHFLPYSQLYKNSVVVLGQLQKLGIKPKDELVLQCSDLELFITYFWACVLGKIIPVTLEIANTQDKAKKLHNVWKVLNNPYIFYDESTFTEKAYANFDKNNHKDELQNILKRAYFIKDLESTGEAGKIEEIHPNDYCYVQFSSGSTGVSKGAPVTHHNLTTNVYDMVKAFNINEKDSFISWKPLSHDFSMIAFHIMPLVMNINHYRMTTSHFVWSPSAWFNVVNKYRISILGSPNFGLRHFLKHYKREKTDVINWDLSCVRLLMNGAETISHRLIKEFVDEMNVFKLLPNAMLPGWGLAEATLTATHCKVGELVKVHSIDRRFLNIGDKVKYITKNESDHSVDFVEVGEPLIHTKVRICDSNYNPLADEYVGHIQVQGETVIKSYYNNPEAFEKIFKDGWLDTGDIGFMKDGHLVFTGRFKDIIIINGVNYYPIEIEEYLLDELGADDLNKYIACGVNNSKIEKEELLIFVYYKGNINGFSPLQKSIKEIVLKKVGLVADHVIPIKQIPKTTSGKVMRYQLINQYLEGEFDKIIEVVDTKENANSKNQAKTEEPKNKLDSIKLTIKKELNNLLGFEVDYETKFFDIGVKSTHISPLTEAINEALGYELQVNHIFDYPTINLLAAFIKDNPLSSKESAISTNANKSESINRNEPVAIIGVGCRFPAGGNSPEEFWQALINSVDGIIEIPKDRWDIDEYYDENKDKPGKMYTKYGGFLQVPIDEFDAHFFNLSPKEVKSMDPQQRLLLEVSWEAFENAGIDTAKLNESNTGVYLGMSGNDYLSAHLHSGDFGKIDAYSLTGTAFSTAAGRLSYFYGLQGPCFSLDTACSSTLVAMHLAFQSLRNKESDMALVGGCHLILGPHGHVGFSKLGAISPDGHSKSFDASANGYARSEGCGIVILKRLSEAIKDNNRILAVIRGTATNQDGKSNGLTAPSGVAQQKVILSALQNSGLMPEEIDYVETHGTGTPLGDPIEVNAIASIYGKNRVSNNQLYIGSVKSNIGHLEPVAGMAGITKIIKAFENDLIPANFAFKTPNPFIDWNNISVKVVSEHKDWHKNGKLRRACINSFGFGGSNAHVILEEPPRIEKRINKNDRDYHILNISAKSSEALAQQAYNYYNYLSLDNTPKDNNSEIGDICYTSNAGRTHFINNRLSICGKEKEDIQNKLGEYIKGNKPNGVYENISVTNDNKIAFLFTGQGSQYVGVGKTLYQTNTIFQASFDKCDELFYPYLLQSIKELVFNPKDDKLVNRTDFAQPIIFSVQIALVEFWKSIGIKPDAVVGHSIGEFAAAVISGILNFEDAVRLVATRGRLMNSAPGHGKMAAIFTDQETVKKIIADYSNKISIAAINLVNSIVISGEAETLDKVVQIFKSQNIEVNPLVVSHAFHSPLMDPILNDFNKVATSIKYKNPQFEFISTLTGKTMELAPDANYWTRHLRESVRFYDAIKILEQKEYKYFLEVGGSPTLTSLSKRIIENPNCVFVNSLKNKINDWQQIAFAIGELYTSGVDFDWNGFDKDFHRTKIDLPTYPFQRKKYWMALTNEFKSTGIFSSDYHPIIGQRISSPALADTIVYQSIFTPDKPYFMSEHIIYDTKISPAAAHVSMLLSIVKDLYGNDNAVLKELEFLAPLVVNDDEQRLVQFIVNPDGGFKIMSRDNTTENTEWQLHCQGNIDKNKYERPTLKYDFNELKTQLNEEITYEGLYDPLKEIGFNLGEGFRRIKHTWRKDHNALCLLEVKNDIPDLNDYSVYPGVIDSIFQTFIPVSGLNLEHLKQVQNIFIPFSLGNFEYYEKFPERFYCYSRAEVQENLFKSNITVISEDGRVLAEIKNLMGRRTDKPTLLKGLALNINKFLYKVEWEKQQLPVTTHINIGNKFIIFSDNTGYADIMIKLMNKHDVDIIKVVKGTNYKELSKEDRCSIIEINPEKKEDYISLFKENSPFSNMLYFWSMDEKITPKGDEFESNQKSIFLSLLHIVNSLIDLNLDNTSKLRIITSKAILSNIKNAASQSINFHQSTVWGFARTLAVEYPDLFDGIIDIENKQCINNGNLLREIISGSEIQVSLNSSNERVVPRFNKYIIEKGIKTKQVKIKQGVTYIITGGLGSLGQLFCEWLIGKDASNIVLTGRSELSKEKEEYIRNLNNKEGLDVRYIKTDISNSQNTNKLFSDIKKNLPEIRGIIHAAGSLEDSMIPSQNWEKYEKVFQPKVFGTMNLHNETLDSELDFFIVFSSLASIAGSAGQSNYSAANEFMNQLINERQRMGLPGKSISWGPWAEIGMAAVQDNRGDRLLKQGIISIKPSDGLKIFETLLSIDSSNPVVIRIDWKTYSEKLSKTQATQFFSNNISTKNSKDDTSSIEDNLILKQLKEVASSERYQLLLDFNLKLAAKIAGFDNPNQINIDLPVMDQGFDSIMAVAIKNNLAKSLNITLPATLFFNYPTLSSITSHILSEYIKFEDEVVEENMTGLGEEMLKELNELIKN